jgi:hypothetical protein
MQKNKKGIARPIKERLNNEEKLHPQAVLSNFCDNYHLHEVKQILWDWLVTAMGKPHSTYDEGKERSNLLFFYENIETLVEAVYTINTQQEKTKAASNKQPPGSKK